MQLLWQIATEVLLQDDSETVGHANFNQALVEVSAALNDSCDCKRIIVLLTDKDADNAQPRAAIVNEELEQLDEVRVTIKLCFVLAWMNIHGTCEYIAPIPLTLEILHCWGLVKLSIIMWRDPQPFLFPNTWCYQLALFKR